jgi:menaquinone-dependent protoporphyrinogen oxidase
MSAGSRAGVLVAYGSKHGATAEIADRIGAILREAGLTVDVRPAGDVDSLDGYRAVVLGSAVYMLRWRRDARRLLRRVRHRRVDQPVWLFSSGPLDHDEHDDMSRIVSSRVRRAADWPGVVDHALFAGRFPIEPSNFIERSMVKKAPEDERDFRDWNAIGAWARKIAESAPRAESHDDAAQHS